MKTKIFTLCILFSMINQVISLAQKTEVIVRKGKVRAETQTATVNIDAGQKTVLIPDKKPTVTVDNPMVDDAMKLYKLAEVEKERGDLKIETICIIVGRANKEEIQGAFYFEVPNYRAEATNVLTIGQVSIMENVKFYDMKGNLCRVEVKKVNQTSAFYSVHFSEEVQPGQHFKSVGVVDLEKMPLIPGGGPMYGQEGPLWHFRIANNSWNSLNYYRLILPESAILVDCNREILSTDTVDGKLAVTIRNYTGPYYDGWCMIFFLWPDEDGTSLADIPEEYHGLRKKQDEVNSRIYKQEMGKIRAGIRYEDQSTPLAALLTCDGSIINKDFDLYAKSKHFTQSPDDFRDRVDQSRYWMNALDFLSTPQWPNNPGNGYVHPIYLCRKGSLICEHMQPIVYEEGQWYVDDSKRHFGAVKKFEKITSQEIENAEAKGYLANWEIAGPYLQRGKKYKDKNHKELFDIPFGPELPGVDVRWQPVTVESHDEHPVVVNIAKNLMYYKDAVAYLRTKIVSDRRKPVRLDFYTDDGIKAWLNGKVILENNVGRGLPEQPDAVNVTLNEGDNQLILKVTQFIFGWEATVKIGSDKAVSPQPTNKAIHPNTQVQLNWATAVTAQSHRVHFGIDPNNLSLMAEVSDVRELQKLSLEVGRRYFWRVDEVLTDGSVVQGDVWTFTTGTLVARWTLDGHAKDQSAQAFHGTLHGDPHWVPGVSNQAIALDSEDDYIIIPPMNLDTNMMTITLWVRTEEIIENSGLVFTRVGSNGLWLKRNNNLRYNWNGVQQAWMWDPGFFVPNKTWTFAALVVDPEKATIYMHDGTEMKSATHNHLHRVMKFDGVTYIGRDPRWSTLKGAIDEVRIYNESLDAKEIEAIYLETRKRP